MLEATREQVGNVVCCSWSLFFQNLQCPYRDESLLSHSKFHSPGLQASQPLISMCSSRSAQGNMIMMPENMVSLCPHNILFKNYCHLHPFFMEQWFRFFLILSFTGKELRAPQFNSRIGFFPLNMCEFLVLG